MELVSRGALWTQTGCGVDSYAAFFLKPESVLLCVLVIVNISF